VNWLPGQSSHAIPPVDGERIGGRKMKLGFATVLAWAVLAAAVLFFAVHYFNDNNLELDNGADVSTQH